MDYQKPELPLETLEHILWLIPDSNDLKECKERKHRPTFLTCALVCKTWMSLARRRLLSLYFPDGRVTIASGLDDVFGLVDIFLSPLCTLDPTFIRILCISSFRKPFHEVGIYHQLFLTVLPNLDASLFPSLQSFEFYGLLLSNENEYHPCTSPSSPIFSQIKSLIIHPPHRPPFQEIIYTIRLCPFVEEVTVWSGDVEETEPHLYRELRPPRSLQKLSLDVPVVGEMVKWMMLSGPPHTTIPSLTICDLAWNEEIGDPDLRKLLNYVGPNLEELVLDMHDWEGQGEFAVDNPDKPLTQFANNTLLRRLTIRATPDAAVEIAPHLLKQALFAPDLEILRIDLPGCYSEEVPYLTKFGLLDQYAYARPSLNQIIISCTGRDRDVEWEEVENIRDYMPLCEGKGILELRLDSEE